MHSYNFIPPHLPGRELDMFFGPVKKEDKFIEIQPRWTMAHIMHAAGIFPSISQARKNGWDKDIPYGFSSHRVSKKRYLITILNITIT